MSAGRQAAMVAVALTAPIAATASTAPLMRGRARVSGMSVHGTSATGQASEEIAVSVVRMRGESAYSMAALTCGSVPRTPVRRARMSAPEYARHSKSVHHARCASHSGAPMASASRKNGPCGKRYP